MEYENENYNQINENMMNEMNNLEEEEDNQYNQYNQYQQYDQYGQENDLEEQYFSDNNYGINKEIISLKNENEQLKKLINQKDQELIKYKQIIQSVNALKKELNIVKQKYISSFNEVRIKNKIIENFKNNAYNFNIDNNNLEQNENNISFIIQKIKNIEKDILEENLDNNEFNNSNAESQMDILIDTLNSFDKKLKDYKNKNMSEIINLRNRLNQMNINNNNSNLATNLMIKDQYYLKIIDTIKNLYNNYPKNEEIGKFPIFSLNDDNEKKNKNIAVTIKILCDYITSNNKDISSGNIINNTYSNSITYENINPNKINEELNKRLKEMSEILVKSNENLSKARKDNIELKQKLNQLELKYNSTKDNINNNDIRNKECELLKEELNKKNKQIKSLEEKITKLNNLSNKKDNKNLENINKNINKESLYFKDNNFVRDEKHEQILKNFLDKFTDGEYGNESIILDKKRNEDIKINNIKEEIENLDRRINKELGNNSNI